MENMGHEVTMNFFNLWNPVILLFVVVVLLLYMRSIVWRKERYSDEEPVSGKQKALFITGMALFYIGQGSPLNFIGQHYLFSAHMLQQSILYLIMPIFILRGLPEWMLVPIQRNKVSYAVLRFFSHPLIAILLFNTLFSIYHVPFVMDNLMAHEFALLGYHAVLLFCAFMMWMPIFTPLTDEEPMSGLKKLAYVFANGVLLTPACALIIFANAPIYSMYQNVNVPFEFLSVLEDQQLGGTLMKIIQEIVYGIVLFVIFRKWYTTERKVEEELSDEPKEGVIYMHESLNKA
jgi:putative membrane protein